jgi:hypothetical protein
MNLCFFRGRAVAATHFTKPEICPKKDLFLHSFCAVPCCHTL